MIVSELIEDLESALEQNSEAGSYRVGFKKSIPDESITYIDSFHWDDEEFFLVAVGDENYFDLKPMKLSAGSFLKALKEIDEHKIKEFAAFARTGVTRTPEGDNISMNLPINGTVISDKKKVVYFFHEDEEDAAIEKRVYLFRVEATASVKGDKVIPGKRYAILSFVYGNKINTAEMLAHHDLFKDGWKDVVTEEKGPFDAATLNKADADTQKAYKHSIENGICSLIFAGD